MKVQTVEPVGRRNIFVSFVEEFWLGKSEDKVVARIEVEYPGDHYPSEEIRILCDQTAEYYEFREKYDFKFVSKTTLKKIKMLVKQHFNSMG
jgi:hypothetical protein